MKPLRVFYVLLHLGVPLSHDIWGIQSGLYMEEFSLDNIFPEAVIEENNILEVEKRSHQYMAPNKEKTLPPFILKFMKNIEYD